MKCGAKNGSYACDLETGHDGPHATTELTVECARLRAEVERLAQRCRDGDRTLALLYAEVERLRRVQMASAELREAERRTEAECSAGDMSHPLVSQAHHAEMRAREKWRAALDAAKSGGE